MGSETGDALTTTCIVDMCAPVRLLAKKGVDFQMKMCFGNKFGLKFDLLCFYFNVTEDADALMLT